MARLLSVTLGAALAGVLVLSAKQAATPERGVAAPVLADARTLFVSGHSLTAPLPPLLQDLARGSGRTLSVEAHLADGSSIRQRLAAGPAAIPPPGTDVLLVTERHWILDTMSREGTVNELRTLDQRFRADNPTGETFFYVPWSTLADTSAPDDWIRHERMVAPLWACLARRASDSPAARPGSRQIHLVPASLALADLAEALNRRPDDFPGFAEMTPREVGAALFSDDVHLTPLGGYFVAVVTSATIFGDVPANAPVPAGLDAARAESLRDFAMRFVAAWRETSMRAEVCSERVGPGLALAYAGYAATVAQGPNASFPRRQLESLRQSLRLFRQLYL
ncbi:hypothetical protein [Antarcticirhabdus aurantiaca]|uniref:Uncharacterized protein n=1 Tax=Antarcticirhabdus aurantiaca TaxID=2606717 RepID=A0ACD4NWG2_9HYPH|nr:hypothetical protein [Antarcticirhabdus aurantiaca]WAJ31101.1 hypothetical protein OXU80_13240 [Jeongeuplla avenae]